MKSPCHDCTLKHEDKNGDECRECNARAEYIKALDNPNIIENIKMGDAMALRGTCKNCERENMSLPNKGMCGKCNYALAHAPEDGKEAALEKSKADIKAGVSINRTRITKEPTKVAIIKPKPAVISEDDFNDVIIQFKTERDRKVKAWLDELSAENRRTPGQQILTTLEDIMEV